MLPRRVSINWFWNQVKFHHPSFSLSLSPRSTSTTGISWRINRSVLDMTSHIPLALSLLGSFAGYPLSSGTQKTASNPPPNVAPSVPPQAPWNAPAAPSPPIHTSGPIPSTNPNAPHNINGTPGTTPPTTNPAASTLCDVSHSSIYECFYYSKFSSHNNILGLSSASQTLWWNQDTSVLQQNMREQEVLR